MNPKPRQRSYVIQTSSEADAFASAAADGKHGRNYEEDEQSLLRHHQRPGASHRVQFSLTPEESGAGLTLAVLEQLTLEQDADAVLMFFYIAQVLAPPSPQPRADYTSGIIDFDDVISMIGWDPRSSEERREMHRRVWQFIRFGERAQVVGKRVGKYKDKHTGKEIETEIHSSPWRIHEFELPEQKSLPFEPDVPVRVQIAMAPAWANLLSAPETAQYLPLGEVLGSIPGNQTKGAWARVIGLALASLWRRNPHLEGPRLIRPARRELITRYPPKTGPVENILASKDPTHAMVYWHAALGILVKKGFIARYGEAAFTLEQMRSQYPRKDWQQEWLDTTVEIQPGPLMEEAVKGRAAALPQPKRGRPRKDSR